MIAHVYKVVPGIRPMGRTTEDGVNFLHGSKDRMR